MWKTAEGGTKKLLQLCGGYFFFYVITGIAVKYFTGSAGKGLPGVGGMEYLVYSTIGSSIVCLFVIFAFKWYKLESNHLIQLGKIKIPVEYIYIIPSGICTAVVIPTTTLMYTLPISIMVAMVIMRGSIIILSRIVDAIQIKQGILHKKVYIEEEFGVIFAILAVGVNLFYGGNKAGEFDFIHSPVAMTILISYIVSYFIRLYIMNYYRNTRKSAKQDNKGFFAIEQISASITMLLVGIFIYYLLKINISQVIQFREAFTFPTIHWPWEAFAGFFYGALAFFSVFIFMFKGRTATFSGLVNRLTSLVAGTVATLLFCFGCGGKFPETEDWVSLVFIFIAVIFLTKAEKKRVAELKSAKELS